MASNGHEMRTMEGYVTAFDTDAYMKDYYPREYFVNLTENQTDLNRAFDHLAYLPIYLQFWLETFSQGKVLINCIDTQTLIRTYIHTYRHSKHSFTYIHIHAFMYLFIHTHIHIYIGLHIFI